MFFRNGVMIYQNLLNFIFNLNFSLAENSDMIKNQFSLKMLYEYREIEEFFRISTQEEFHSPFLSHVPESNAPCYKSLENNEKSAKTVHVINM